MVERIRDAQVAEEIAAQAGTENTPPLFLNEALTPVIFGPQRPPLAKSGYFPGCIGLVIPAVALNVSMGGIFVSGANTNTIVRVNTINIMNLGGSAESYTIRRVDDAGAFTIAAIIPGYIDAGNPQTHGLLTAVKSDVVAPLGTVMGQVTIQANQSGMTSFPGPWIINNGALIVAPNNVNTQLRIYMNYEHWTSIRRQPSGG